MPREATIDTEWQFDAPYVKQLRHLPVGAEVLPDGHAHFRVWASQRRRVEVVLEGGPGQSPGAGVGTLYHYRLDGEAALYPDPASRFQPCGPHGPSQVIDPDIFEWHDGGWHGMPRAGQVIYEMHLGTFTPEGTWEAASRELPELAKVGITVLEIMPIADF